MQILEKGKLGQGEDKKSENNSNSNIFDDDFIRGDFGNDQDDNDDKKNVEEDHKSFVQKIQDAFSSSPASKRKTGKEDYIDDNERERKT